MKATVSYTVQFRPTPRVAEPEPAGRVPRIARLLALAHKIDAMIRSGEIPDLATAARLCGVTRPRMTQISNLRLLAPEIQEAILTWQPIQWGRDPVSERQLRRIVAEPVWEKQAAMWREQLPRLPDADLVPVGVLE